MEVQTTSDRLKLVARYGLTLRQIADFKIMRRWDWEVVGATFPRLDVDSVFVRRPWGGKNRQDTRLIGRDRFLKEFGVKIEE